MVALLKVDLLANGPAQTITVGRRLEVSVTVRQLVATKGIASVHGAPGLRQRSPADKQAFVG